MAHPRIRWKNVGRLAVGLGACGLLVGVAPGALEPPEPAPLPPDVGLVAQRTAATPQPAPPRRPARREHAVTRPPRPEPRPPAARANPDRRAAGHSAPPDVPAVEPAPAPAPAPPPPAATQPAPAAAPAPPPAPPADPPPEPEPQPAPAPHHVDGPAPFGFEH